jgi:hypothetical protein
MCSMRTVAFACLTLCARAVATISSFRSPLRRSGVTRPADQRELVRAVRPEAVSIAFRELFAASDEDGTNREFVHWAAENRVAIQWILYDPSDVMGPGQQGG